MILVGNLILEGELLLDGQLIGDDFSTTNDFSYKKVESSEILKIPQSRQMIVDGNFIVEGVVLLEGSLSIINDSDTTDQLTPYFIQSARRYSIKSGYEFFLATNLLNEGTMINEGRLVVGG
jgi:hypothetical protein